MKKTTPQIEMFPIPRARKNAAVAASATKDSKPGVTAFSFGDPEPVMNGRDILDYIECWRNGKWFEPPVSPAGLAKSFRASTHHSSAIYFKRDVLLSCFKPHRLLNRDNFSAWALDYLVFGNSYLERRNSRTTRTVELKHALAKYTRRGVDMESHWFVPGWGMEHEFPAGNVFHLREHDINQEIYGVPQYLSSLQAAWLNESATLFRRKYYNNGSHAGFILYVSDPAQKQEDIDNMREALKNSKGPGNFRNLFLYSPNGKKDGIQIIPISEVAARDEFMNIKTVSRDDILAAHRVPPQLMGIVPGNTGGFGAVMPAAQVFVRNEIKPLMERFRALNEWVGEEVVQFEQYMIEAVVMNQAQKSGAPRAAGEGDTE
ncbi:phage portal protein [Leptospira sp. 96542]|nr:phage portal protein [Leptospira sp. 96542]